MKQTNNNRYFTWSRPTHRLYHISLCCPILCSLIPPLHCGVSPNNYWHPVTSEWSRASSHSHDTDSVQPISPTVPHVLFRHKAHITNSQLPQRPTAWHMSLPMVTVHKAPRCCTAGWAATRDVAFTDTCDCTALAPPSTASGRLLLLLACTSPVVLMIILAQTYRTFC